MRTFENPANGYKEEVGFGSVIGVFFFGAIYLAIKGLWRHVFLWLIVVVGFAMMTGGPGALIAAPAAGFVYAFVIRDILANDYLAKGWRELKSVFELRAEKAQRMALDAQGAPWRAFDSPKSPELPEVKKCPFCAEEVKYEAIKCKHCHSDLTTVDAS